MRIRFAEDGVQGLWRGAMPLVARGAMLYVSQLQAIEQQRSHPLHPASPPNTLPATRLIVPAELVVRCSVTME